MKSNSKAVREADPLGSRLFKLIAVIIILGTILTLNGSRVKLQNNLEVKQTEVEQSQQDILEHQKEIKRVQEEKAATELQLQENQTQVEQLNKENESLKTQISAKKRAQAQLALQPRTSTTSAECSRWLSMAGIPETYAVKELIRRESNCSPTVRNKSSGACGISQSLPCSKMGCAIEHTDTAAVCQLQWMDRYVQGRYGSWEAGLSAHNQKGWY